MTDASHRLAAMHTLLDQALDLPPAEREAWLARLREEQSVDVGELEALLAAEADLDARGFLSEGTFGEQRVPPGLAGQRLGAYTLDRPLGQGGMGTVWLARRSDGRYEGTVAVKLLNLALLDPVGSERFRREGTLLARLNHPNIARLMDAGVTEAGQPFLVLEHVQGNRIDRYADACRLSPDERIKLVLDVLAAVGHAHANLIVHRDIKPSNILVTETGVVKLLDFGIAKLLESDSPDRSATLTEAGGSALTPEYAAPEQVGGEPITTATDVYAIGVLLYLLLSGLHPTSHDCRTTAEVIRALEEVEPARLGLGDLDSILATALRKRPSERYQTVAALADDLRRYLGHEPVSASRDSLSYRASRFLRRNRIGVAVGVTVILLLGGSTVLSSLQSARTARERDKAERLSSFLVDLLGASDPYRGRGESATVRELLDSAAPRLDRELTREPEVRADLLSVMGRAYTALGLRDRAWPLLDSSIVIRERLGQRDMGMVRDLSSVAFLHRLEGHRETAESLWRRSLAIAQMEYGELHPNVTLPLKELGNFLRQQKRFDEAGRMLEEAVAIQRTQPRDSILGLADAVHLLAHLEQARGRGVDAERLFREAIALNIDSLGREAALVGELYNDLGALLYQRLDTAAEGYTRRAIVLMPDPDRVAPMMRLVRMLSDRREWAAAESVGRTALAISREREVDGFTTLSALLGLGRLHLAKADTAAAVPFLRSAVGMAERFMPADSPELREAKRNLAEAERAVGGRE